MGLLVRPVPGISEKDRQQGTCGWRLEGPLPGSLSVFGCENIFKTMPPTCLWTPQVQTFGDASKDKPASGLWVLRGPQLTGWGPAECLPSFLWAHLLPQPASSGFRSGSASPMELLSYFKAASGGHQDTAVRAA